MGREQRRALAKVERQYSNKAARGIGIAATNGEWTEWEEQQSYGSAEAQLFPSLSLAAVYKNNRYVVMICHEKLVEGVGMTRRIMIRDNLARPIHNWMDFQRIKNELFGEEYEAIELYPRQAELVNSANIYHLWILPREYNSPFTL